MTEQRGRSRGRRARLECNLIAACARIYPGTDSKTPPVIGRRDSVFALTERGGAVADVHVDALAGGVLIELAHELLAVGVDDLRGQALLLVLRHGAQNALDDARRGLGRVAGELEHGVDIAALAQRS